jgi:hypothetical protein
VMSIIASVANFRYVFMRHLLSISPRIIHI